MSTSTTTTTGTRSGKPSLLERLALPAITITGRGNPCSKLGSWKEILAVPVLTCGRLQAIMICHSPLAKPPVLDRATRDLIYAMLPATAKLYPLCARRWTEGSKLLSYSAVIAVEDWIHAREEFPPESDLAIKLLVKEEE